MLPQSTKHSCGTSLEAELERILNNAKQAIPGVNYVVRCPLGHNDRS